MREQQGSDTGTADAGAGSAAAIRLGDLPAWLAPKGRNEPPALLGAWTALEALSPQTFREHKELVDGDAGCFADLSSGSLPWQLRESPRRDHKLYYQVVLGEIPMDLATAELVRAFGDDEELPRREREKAAIASILIDANGLVMEERAVAISSFAWAFSLVQERKLTSVGAWTVVEPRLVDALQRIVYRVDDEGTPLPLDMPTIQKARDWLLSELRLPATLVAAPAFALRVHQHVKAKNRPEPLLLNSFFLEDLARVSKLIRENGGGAGLRRYLGEQRPNTTIDLLTDKQALERLLAPAAFPPARWPIPGGHPLVLLQQAAVNAARAELAGSEGIVAVNGPPGTGKTTLLRDLVAQCVVDRAAAMVSFDDPDRAFTASGTTMPVGDRAHIKLYRLDPALQGHEIVIASTNNRAVENVSKEIPAAAAVADPEALEYFKSVSDFLFEQLARARGGEQQSNVVETWGLIAAVLGNAGNRAAFQRAFWWDDDRSLRLYLKAAKGDSVVKEIRDPVTNKIIGRRLPHVVTAQQPPASPTAAKANWAAARSRFQALKQDIDAELAALEQVRKICLQIAAKRNSIEAAEAEYRLSAETVRQAEAALQARQAECEDSMLELRSCVSALDLHKHSRPCFLARLFRTRKWKDWSVAAGPIEAAKRRAMRQVAQAKKAVVEATSSLAALSARLSALELALQKPRRAIEKLERSLDSMRDLLGDRIVDGAFLAREHAQLNLSSAWMPETLQRKREELFAAAMAVHRAFIDSAAQKVLHNLSFFMKVLGAGATPDEKQPELLRDLWSTFFAVVPVVSTTFASVGRMLGELSPASLGWLFIDEAGQALPQAAVGAVMRARRTIVVGDQLQIPPVISLPTRLIQEICTFFQVDHAQWSAPKSSAQTLADSASHYRSSFEGDEGPRRVGIPLLVHRRCQNPMFHISNTMAYNGLMVHAAGPQRPGAVGELLGASQWFDLDGEARSKWCEDEGEWVVDLLRRLAAVPVLKPDIFIISPFRIVAQSMRQRLLLETGLFDAFDVPARDWISERVGTIHTFQGGEANTVILLLGAPNAAQHRSRQWAAETPNILNVAVSRAQQNLYVVGSHASWSGVGHCHEVAQNLVITRSRQV